MKLCSLDVQPGHGGAERSGREGLARHQTESVEL